MAEKTWEPPLRSVMRRWRSAGVTWVELSCGHDEPATGKDRAVSLRCQQCDPVMKPASVLAAAAKARG